MFRIKDRYCSNTKLMKWIAVIALAMALLIAAVSLFSGNFLQECNHVILQLLLAIICYESMKVGNKIEQIDDPQGLISEYDRINYRLWWIIPIWIIPYLLCLVFLNREFVMAAIIGGVIVVLILIFVLLGVGKDNDIERMRELVNQEIIEK